jgi:phosphate transport system substrate-binding protein
VALLLDVPRAEAAEKINFTGTADSFRALMGNRADLVISYEPPPAVIEEADEANFKWELAAIGRDALVFIVNESNPIESITTEEARKIYTGEITNWKELGGSDVEIEPFQRNETSGSQTLFIKLVMGDTPPMTPDTKYISGGMGPLIESVASFNNTGAAIGFSVFYYAQNMNPNDGLKFLAIDGVAPTRDTIRDGSYPHVNDFFAGIAQNEPQNSNARKIFDWLQSEDGKALIEHEGYVSIS